MHCELFVTKRKFHVCVKHLAKYPFLCPSLIDCPDMSTLALSGFA